MAKSDIFKLSGISRTKSLKAVIPIVRAYLNDSLDTYLSLLQLTESTSEELINTAIQDEAAEKMLTSIYQTVCPKYAKRTHEAIISGKVKLDWSSTVFTNWLSDFVATETAFKVVNITSTTRELIRMRLAKAIKDGLSIPNMAKQIRSEMEGINRRRAIKIARTEVISSSNAASLHGAAQSGANVLKIWIPAKQMRTRGARPKDRFDHFHMDQHKPIPLMDTFNVSGEALMYPGDAQHGASAGNTINCRCAIGYVRAK